MERQLIFVTTTALCTCMLLSVVVGDACCYCQAVNYCSTLTVASSFTVGEMFLLSVAFEAFNMSSCTVIVDIISCF